MPWTGVIPADAMTTPGCTVRVGESAKFFHGSNPVADITILDNAAHDAESVLLHPNAWFARRWLLDLKEVDRKTPGNHSALRRHLR